MSATSNPRVSIALLAAQLAQTIKGRNDLICGSLIASATAVSGQLYTDVGKKTNSELDSLFGANTDLRNKIKQFIASNGGYSQLNVKALSEDGAGTTATGKIAIGSDGSGAATEDGELIVSLVDEFQWQETITVVTGDTDAVIAGKIVTAFTGNATLPLTIAINGTNACEADLTSVDKCTIANFYGIKVEGNVAGLSSSVVTAMSGGTNNPDVSTFFDNLQSTRFTGINWPTAWISDLNVLKTYLDSRFNAANAILDGVGFVGNQDTFANVKSVVDAQNSQSILFGGYQKTAAGGYPSVVHPADWALCYFQGVRARRLTNDAPIATFVTSTSGTLDAFGGPALASLPYFNTPMLNMNVSDPNDLYTNQEQVELEESGFSVIGVNSAENQMITGPMVTTYTTDAAGNPNDSFHYLNYVDTASVCREYFFNNLKSRFSQSRLTNGTLVPGRSMENENSIRAEFNKLYKQLSDLSLTIRGAEAEKFFRANLVVTPDLAQRKVTVSMQLPIVTQLGNIIVSSQLNFNFQEV